MEDRKLYHLVNGEFVYDGMPSVRIPTYEEVKAHIAILQNVGFFDDPIAESVPAWDGLGTGKRSDAVQASLFDCIHAELLGERDAEKAKVRNRRKADRKHFAENWGQEKLNRKDRHFDYMCRDSRRKYGHGKTCYWSSNAERKIVHAERNIRADFDAEIHQHEDALAYHSDYLDMAIDHGERLEYLRKQIRKLDYERMVIANYDREIKYEQNRVNELMRIADTIIEGECY